MSQAYLTTRRGNIDNITLYRYDFSNDINKEQERKEKFINWLQKQSAYPICYVENKYFITFSELPNNWQYNLIDSNIINSPFENTTKISNYINKFLKDELKKHFKQFLNQNCFIIKEIDVNPFQLLKVIEYNIELFPSGQYLIHILPAVKILSNQYPINKNYINNLKMTNKNISKAEEMKFTLINTKKYYRKEIDLLDKRLPEQIGNIFNEDSNFIASFNYHFLANYSNEHFIKIIGNTTKNLNQIISFIDSILDYFKMPDIFKLSEDRFFQIETIELGNRNNLLVGCKTENFTIHTKSITRFGTRIEYTSVENDSGEMIVDFIKDEKSVSIINELILPTIIKAKVEKRDNWQKSHITRVFSSSNEIFSETRKQSASYYNGIYKPANNCNILPIISGNFYVDVFYKLISEFNRNSQNFKILSPIFLAQNDVINEKKILEIKKSEKNPILAALFCEYQMPKDFFTPLKVLKYQIYQGNIDYSKESKQKLSNYVCKCLEKLGGIISIIADTHFDNHIYFIGIDMGHSILRDNNFSNFAAVLFNNHGLILGKSIISQLPKKENLIEYACIDAFDELDTIIEKRNFPKPKHIIIHRDGKLHSMDIEILIKSIKDVWGGIQIDIVEIIKSGHPIIFLKKDNNEFENPTSGLTYLDNENRYAIIVTNTQADEHNAVIRPIIIKHKYGETDFNFIVDQVYWFTKIYTNNLFNSTRLPATTLKANNYAGTSIKTHYSSYLG